MTQGSYFEVLHMVLSLSLQDCSPVQCVLGESWIQSFMIVYLQFKGQNASGGSQVMGKADQSGFSSESPAVLKNMQSNALFLVYSFIL